MNGENGTSESAQDFHTLCWRPPSRARSLNANLQARPQKDKIEWTSFRILRAVLTKAGDIEKSIGTRKPDRANGTAAAAVIGRTITGKFSRNPRSPPFLMNHQNVSPSATPPVSHMPTGIFGFRNYHPSRLRESEDAAVASGLEIHIRQSCHIPKPYPVSPLKTGGTT